MNPKDEAFTNAEEALKKARETSMSADQQMMRDISSTISQNFAETVEPMMVEMKRSLETSTSGLVEAIKGINLDLKAPDVQMPEIKFPEFNIPEPKVIVNFDASQIKVPEVNIPPSVFPSLMNVLLEGIDRQNPLPVLVVDETGKPFYGGGGSSGGGSSKVIQEILDKNGTSLIDSSTPSVPVLRTSATVSFPTSSLAAALVDSSGVQYSGSNPLPTTASLSLPSGQGDAATATRVVVAGNSDMSVVVNSGTLTAVTGVTNSIQTALIDSSGVQYSGSNPLPTTATLSTAQGQGDAATAMRVVIAGNSDASVVVNSGTITTVTAVTNITNSIQTVILDRDSNPFQPFVYGTGDAATAQRVLIAGNSDSSVVVNSGTITTVTTLTSVTNSIQTALIDSSGVQYSGTNPVPVTLANAGTTQNVNVTGQNDSMLTLVSHTTLPTAKADGADTRGLADKYGRPTMRPIQVRDLIATAYVSLTTGTEATFLAAVAGNLYDLVWVMMSNQSTAAVQVDIRPVTAGNILMTFQVPANGTVGIAPPVPLPGGADTGNNWTVDMPDITGTTVNITGLFSREI